MNIFSSALSIEILDGVAAALLAAAAVCRAKGFGAHLTGALAVGCMAGIAGAVARETILHGAEGASLVISAIPAEAFIGAIAALFARTILPEKTKMLFFWLDAASMGLAGSLGAMLGLSRLGLTGALALGLLTGLLPGLARDVALGDTAMLVEQDWYAAAVALGCILTLTVCFMAALGSLPDFILDRAGEWAVVAGAAAVLALRAWKGNRFA